ncbi:uncharacterized protein M421DRAFT_62740 [Didymella exigua CBS 183.55]|uniref:Heterokaryon incompatibility domain-containing protein n=1 Tax=Didymella exigua CBS 183.55 TaxID=1150837 RepID=A0A6A5RLG9_9PLEO|nr:uncharacterized protein M421DRAFT_62740 [Didymella exigua CBS 183.55]KAF1928509.1 hypothetical protein M421DRAFT_62740 [Didymella exigua CBS 183.55]
MPTELEYEIDVPFRDANYEPLGDALFRLTLSEENKAEIFEYGLSRLSQSQQEASKIFQNLARWDPTTRLMFASRSSSTVLNTPFRLVFPNADLSSFDETGLYVRQYMVVSYCWHSKDFFPDGYERHGDWPISKPFVDAIIGEKNHARVGIWMDQLCINQESPIDKQKSVAAMDVIYRSCLRLLVLLEDVYLDETEVKLFEKYDLCKVTKYNRAWTPPVEDQAPLNGLLAKIVAARWWQRAWCLHEFSVNEPWSDKRQCNEIHNATFIMNGPLGSIVRVKWWTLFHVAGMAPNLATDCPGMEIFMPVDNYKDREPGWRSSLIARHNHASRKGCLLLADKISIMINMCGIGFAYQGPALGSTDEVLYISTLLALAAGETYPLTLFDNRIPARLLETTSWLQRRLTDDLQHELFVSRFRPRSMSGIHRISMQYIELDMVFLPAPARWTKAADTDISITYRIFPETIPTTRSATHRPLQASFETVSHPYEILDELRRNFLAGCIKNGYSFTARLWAQLERDVVGPNYNQGLYKDLSSNPVLLPAAQRLIAQLLPVSTLLGVLSPPSFAVKDAQLFLTWLTDPRSVYYIGTETNCIQCSIDGEVAFSSSAMFNENFKSGSVEELRAAVPTDLLDEGCMPIRIWLLCPGESEDGTERWRLVGKTLLLGDSDLRKEANESKGREDAVVEIRRVVVGG